MAKYSKKLTGVYKHTELEKILGSKMAVKRAASAGLIEKVTRGYYAAPDVATNQAYYLIIKKYYPKSVISKRALLYHYKLTTDQPAGIDIDVVTDSKLRKDTELISIHRTNKIFNTTTTEFNSVKLKSYSVERALFEVLYFEKKPGQLTSEVVRNYIIHYKYEPAIIQNIAVKFGKRALELANLIQVLSGK
ncbi:MAG: hypothetical protein ABL930_03390 [Pseudobdellovibrio sp.]